MGFLSVKIDPFAGNGCPRLRPSVSAEIAIVVGTIVGLS